MPTVPNGGGGQTPEGDGPRMLPQDSGAGSGEQQQQDPRGIQRQEPNASDESPAPDASA